MKTILATTILASALAAGPVLAQAVLPSPSPEAAALPAIVAPDGFVRQDSMLAADELVGATIYDSNGDSIGDVHDLVLDTGAGAGAAPPADGQTSHAILDIGGFLGMGEHRVAVPVVDLQVYRSEGETRVYLPWSKAQLEALPVYDADNPATLGHSAMPPAN